MTRGEDHLLLEVRVYTMLPRYHISTFSTLPSNRNQLLHRRFTDDGCLPGETETSGPPEVHEQDAVLLNYLEGKLCTPVARGDDLVILAPFSVHGNAPQNSNVELNVAYSGVHAYLTEAHQYRLCLCFGRYGTLSIGCSRSLRTSDSAIARPNLKMRCYAKPPGSCKSRIMLKHSHQVAS